MKLTVGQKLGMLTGVALLGIGLLTIAGDLLTNWVYERASYASVNSMPSIELLGRAHVDFMSLRLWGNRLLINDDPARTAELEGLVRLSRKSFEDAIDHYVTDGCLGGNCLSDDRDRDFLARIRQRWEMVSPIFDDLIADAAAGRRAQAQEKLTASQAALDQLDHLLDDHVAYNAELGHQSTEAALKVKKQSLMVALSIAAATLSVVGMIGLLMARQLIRQLGGEPSEAARMASRIAIGDLRGDIALRPGDQTSVLARIKILNDTLARVADRADAIGAGDLLTQLDLLSEHDRLGRAINTMTQRLLANREEDARRDWLQQGASQLSMVMTGDHSFQSLAEIAITTLGRYLGAGRGVLYAYRPEDKQVELVASYMYSEHSSLGSRFAEGEGAVGQVARERKPIILTSVPSDAAPIVTGTASAQPLTIYCYPLLREQTLMGVIELAAFDRFDETKQAYFEAATGFVASFLYVADQRDKIQKLLKLTEAAEFEARQQRDEMQKINVQLEEQQQQLQQQSEELRQSNAQMEEQQQQLQQQSEELQQSNTHMEEQKQQLMVNNAELARSQDELTNKAALLENSNRYKSEFLANMSHELRTPLNAIILLSKMMMRNDDGRLDGDEVKRAEVIHRSGEDLLRLINDVLDLSKVEAGRMELRLSEVSTRDIAAQLHDLFEPTAHERGVVFTIEDRLGATILTDDDKLGQILRNLLSNAFKFTKQGSVILSFEHQPDQQLPTRIAVSDSGIGIAKDRQAIIFEAFHQVDGSTAREFGGTGLGLTISARLVELLGGAITIDSAPGRGSTFCVCLPDGNRRANGATTDSAERSQPRIDADSAVDDRHTLQDGDQIILVIDDDADFTAEVLGINRRLGYKTVIGHTAEQGWDLAKRYRPAGLLLDLGLPDRDGLDLLHDIKADPELMGIPVYIVSARDRDEVVPQHQIVGYLQKPVNDQQIAQAGALLVSAEALAANGDILVMGSGGIDADLVRQTFSAKGKPSPATIREVGSESSLLSQLALSDWHLVIIDLTGRTVDDACAVAEQIRQVRPAVSLLFYGLHVISEEEDGRLRAYSDSVIVKVPQAERRLLRDIERFLQKVPAAGKSADRKTARVNGEKRLRERSILVIDDDPRNLFVITATLEQQGARIVNAISGKRALEILAEDAVDLMITDIMMPEMDGYQLITAVRENPRLAKMPIIALTAKATPQDRAKALSVGSNDFLTKPVDYDVLVNMAALWCARDAD